MQSIQAFMRLPIKIGKAKGTRKLVMKRRPLSNRPAVCRNLRDNHTSASLAIPWRCYTTTNPLFAAPTNSVAVFTIKSSMSFVSPGYTPIQKTLFIT